MNQEFNKIVCQRDPVGALTASVVLEKQVGGKISAGEIRKAQERLRNAPTVKITDFGFTPLPGPSVGHELYATIGVYSHEWNQMDALILFQQEIARLTGVTCCIDCSMLSSHEQKRSRRAPN